MYNRELLRDAFSGGYNGIGVKYGWQSNNPGGWQNMYLYPSYGFGWFKGYVGDREILGKPDALYGFISFPLFNYRRFQMVIEPAVGISYNLKPFDKYNNFYNHVIGSRINIYFNMSVGGRFMLNNSFDLVYGYNFFHFSNGRVYMPNSGINMYGPSLGIRYNFNVHDFFGTQSDGEDGYEARPLLHHFERAVKRNEFNLLVYGAAGIVQNRIDIGTSRHHAAFTGIIELQYVLNTKNAFNSGLNFFYDNSIIAQIPGERPEFYAFHVGYDYTFWKLSGRFQVGSYFTARDRDLKGNFFMRPALKLDISRRLYLQLGLKTLDGARADWIEWGIGVNFGNIL